MKTPFIFDGATGTYLQELAPLEEGTFEEYNLTKPQVVKTLHRAYRKAGAMGLKTNTFGANTVMLKDPEKVEAVIRAGATLARECADGAEVFASIGPMRAEALEALEEYKAISHVFLEEGVTHFLFETFPEGSLFPVLGKYIKEKCPEAFIIVSFAVLPSGETAVGAQVEDLVEEAQRNPYIDVIGLNCVAGPRHMTAIARQLPEEGKPLCLMPNASYPTITGGRTFYGENPVYFAEELAHGSPPRVKFFGGCCGTDPSYIAALIKALEEGDPGLPEIVPKAKLTGPHHKNPFWEKLKKGRFPVVVEYDPPADLDIEQYMKNVKYLENCGIDGITLADCPVARVRIDAGIMGLKIMRETGLTPIVHMTCRDRNINATKALLLGLSMEGIRNVLLITGDPIPTAERDEVKAVFQMNSVRLAKFVRRLNEEVFPDPVAISGALNINARNFPAELKKAKRKEASGMEIFFTQPVLSQRALENLAMARKELTSYIMGGLIPVVSARNARFMESEISGITMEEEVLYSFTDDMTREEGEKQGIRWVLEFAERARDLVDGFYLITPFNRVEVIGEILKQLRS